MADPSALSLRRVLLRLKKVSTGNGTSLLLYLFYTPIAVMYRYNYNWKIQKQILAWYRTISFRIWVLSNSSRWDNAKLAFDWWEVEVLHFQIGLRNTARHIYDLFVGIHLVMNDSSDSMIKLYHLYTLTHSILKLN